MKQADRSGADFAVILEEGGAVQLRDMGAASSARSPRPSWPTRSPPGA